MKSRGLKSNEERRRMYSREIVVVCSFYSMLRLADMEVLEITAEP
jgi:hypothetical protein